MRQYRSRSNRTQNKREEKKQKRMGQRGETRSNTQQKYAPRTQEQPEKSIDGTPNSGCEKVPAELAATRNAHTRNIHGTSLSHESCRRACASTRFSSLRSGRDSHCKGDSRCVVLSSGPHRTRCWHSARAEGPGTPALDKRNTAGSQT